MTNVLLHSNEVLRQRNYFVWQTTLEELLAPLLRLVAQSKAEGMEMVLCAASHTGWAAADLTAEKPISLGVPDYEGLLIGGTH